MEDPVLPVLEDDEGVAHAPETFKASYVVGRGKDCDVRIEGEPGISWHHLEIVTRDGQWLVRDLGSTNGTRLNGELLRADELHPVASGAILQLGPMALRLRFADLDVLLKEKSTSPKTISDRGLIVPETQRSPSPRTILLGNAWSRAEEVTEEAVAPQRSDDMAQDKELARIRTLLRTLLREGGAELTAFEAAFRWRANTIGNAEAEPGGLASAFNYALMTSCIDTGVTSIATAPSPSFIAEAEDALAALSLGPVLAFFDSVPADASDLELLDRLRQGVMHYAEVIEIEKSISAMSA